MPTETRPGDGGLLRRRWPWIAGAVALLLVVAAVWWGVAARAGLSTTAADTPRASSQQTPQTSPQPPAPTPTPGATGAETPAPADPGDGAPAADDPFPQRTAVALESKTEVDAGVTVAMSRLSAVDGQAATMGDVAGPAIRFTLTFTNPTDTDYSTEFVTVNTYYGADETPAETLSKPGGVPLAKTVPAHGSVAATYIFKVPEDQRKAVLVTVDYKAGAPAIAFQGAAP